MPHREAAASNPAPYGEESMELVTREEVKDTFQVFKLSKKTNNKAIKSYD